MWIRLKAIIIMIHDSRHCTHTHISKYHKTIMSMSMYYVILFLFFPRTKWHKFYIGRLCGQIVFPAYDIIALLSTGRDLAEQHLYPLLPFSRVPASHGAVYNFPLRCQPKNLRTKACRVKNDLENQSHKCNVLEYNIILCRYLI